MDIKEKQHNGDLYQPMDDQILLDQLGYMDELQAYAELVSLGNPDFIEVKVSPWRPVPGTLPLELCWPRWGYNLLKPYTRSWMFDLFMQKY